jgi:hypothetical protein
VTTLRNPHAGLLVVAVVASCLVAPADGRAADGAGEYLADIGTARASAALAAVDGKVYVIGG